MQSSQLKAGDRRPIGPKETIVLLAGLMALNALAIDVMIPALGAIGDRFRLETANDRQLVVVAYMAGFGSTQLVWGPLADRFGRKPVLATGIALYVAFAFVCAVSESFAVLVAARALQGASAGVTRVLVMTMARDLFEGEEMARVMSLVFMTFMVVPVIAPSIGQLILLAGPWRLIFFLLAAYGLAMLVWSWLRLPESLHPEYRRTLGFGDIAGAAWMTLSDRKSLGYTLALTAAFGALTAYIASIQQIVFEAFGAGDWIGPVFAAIAAPMALASWANSRIVGQFGLRRVGHSGAAAFAFLALFHALLGQMGLVTLGLFVSLQAVMMMAFAFTTSNLNALALENMAPIAGSASSVQGSIGTIGGAAIGFAIGRSFDGSVQPFLWGTAACGIAAFTLVVLTEPRHLFARIRTGSEGPIPPAAPEDLV